MKIIYRKGNVLDAVERHIVNQANCQGRYASGIAKQIRERFPQAYHSLFIHFTQYCRKTYNGFARGANALTDAYGGSSRRMPGIFKSFRSEIIIANNR